MLLPVLVQWDQKICSLYIVKLGKENFHWGRLNSETLILQGTQDWLLMLFLEWGWLVRFSRFRRLQLTCFLDCRIMWYCPVSSEFSSHSTAVFFGGLQKEGKTRTTGFSLHAAEAAAEVLFCDLNTLWKYLGKLVKHWLMKTFSLISFWFANASKFFFIYILRTYVEYMHIQNNPY